MHIIPTQKQMLYKGQLAGELLDYYKEAHGSRLQEIIVMWIVAPREMDLLTILE